MHGNHDSLEEPLLRTSGVLDGSIHRFPDVDFAPIAVPCIAGLPPDSGVRGLSEYQPASVERLFVAGTLECMRTELGGMAVAKSERSF